MELAGEALMHRSLSVLVHADSKVGKSTLAATTPPKRCFMDVEAAYRFLPLGKVIKWDPMKDAPPAADGDWDTAVVITQNYDTFAAVKRWLVSGQHGFVSVILDSITELQVRCKDKIRSGSEDMDMRKWGSLLDQMERDIRDLRDLTEHQTNPLQAIVMTAMTSQKDGKFRPYVQGQLSVKLPYFLDVIGYMYVEDVRVNPDHPTDFTTKKVRKMLTVPHAQFMAGNRVQGRLPEIMEIGEQEQTVITMLDMVFGKEESK